MISLHEIGYSALCCMVALESIALRSILQEILWIKSVTCHPIEKIENLEIVNVIPPFRLRVLGSTDQITNETLRGRDVLMLFINAARTQTLQPEVITASVYALWGKTDECLYIVCDGPESDCRRLSDRHRLREDYGDTVKILIDDTSEVTAAFGVIATPSALMFDERGQLTKSGSLSSVSDKYVSPRTDAGQPTAA